MNTTNGSQIPFTGINKLNLCIHYQPGARGDFLASVLTGIFEERQNGALQSPRFYHKVHYDFENDATHKTKKYICIRIDENYSTENVMQIVFNQFLKDPQELVNGYIDNFYTRVQDCFYKRREVLDRDDYDYWIDFSCVDNINFLKHFYSQLRCHSMPVELEQNAIANIQKQLYWKTTQPELEKLSWLIEFEYKLNLLNWNKTFSIQEYMAHNDPKSILVLSNYSSTPFVI
jgi:hypothetical protein